MAFLLMIPLACAVIALIPALGLYFVFRTRTSEAQRRNFGKLGLAVAAAGVLVLSASKQTQISDWVLLILAYSIAGYFTAWEWGKRGLFLAPTAALVAVVLELGLKPESGYFGPAPLFFIFLGITTAGLVGGSTALFAHSPSVQKNS